MYQLLRIFITAVVFITFINALVFFGLGVYFSLQTYWHLLSGIEVHRPGVTILESIDRFFVGFIFVIFSIGLAHLFLPDARWFQKIKIPWLQLNNFFELKMLLWSTILTALFVAWVVDVLSRKMHLTWPDMIIPGSILILGVAAGFVKKIH